MVVNLSPIELDMDDCGTTLGFKIEIQSKSHADSLRHKYYIDHNGHIKEYDPIDTSDEIGKIYSFRSPVCCANKNFKICKICFGNYTGIKSKYVGILAGQSISERLTQLTMRTFHTSGSSDLPTNQLVIDIIKNKLKDIVNTDDSCEILFEPSLMDNEIEILKTIKGFEKFNHTIDQFDKNETRVTYINLYNVINRDVTETIKEVKKLTQSQMAAHLMPIDVVYRKFIMNALSVGQIYSTFVEIVLCNMYITKDNEIWRMALQKDINSIPIKKLNVKILHTVVSKLLGLLYEPNEKSICKFADINNPLPITNNTVLERFWNEL